MNAMPMAGQTQLGAALSFVGMWTVMMAAMMLPSLAPTLWRFRLTLDRAGGARLPMMALVGAGYFFVLTLFGVAAYPFSVALGAVTRAVPIALAVVVLVGGLLQLSDWKAHHLACWRIDASSHHAPRISASAAWRQGLRLGVHCAYCCAGITAILLAIGDMSLRTMALATAAITVERLAPNGARISRGIGVAAVCAGLLLIEQVV